MRFQSRAVVGQLNRFPQFFQSLERREIILDDGFERSHNHANLFRAEYSAAFGNGGN